MACKKKIPICFLVTMSIFLVTSLDYAEIARKRKLRRSKYDFFVRCTRRFTPGPCIESVVSVWTFVFQLQNCTERYGCPQDWRTNRFSTYGRCIRRCKPLVDLYTEILSRDPQNLSEYLRSRNWDSSGRRDLGDEENDPDLETDDYEVPKRMMIVKGPAPSPYDDDSEHMYPLVTADIDYIAEESVKSND